MKNNIPKELIPQIRLYPKTYEESLFAAFYKNYDQRLGSFYGPYREFEGRMRDLFRGFADLSFKTFVRYAWLELHFAFDGVRRKNRRYNGFHFDRAYGTFMKRKVGYNNKMVGANTYYKIVSTYFKDFFPDFLNHDPFKEPRYFKFPYPHLTLDHLVFVWLIGDVRLALLKKAEARRMGYADFCNFAVNWCFSHNEAVGRRVYVLSRGMRTWPYLDRSPEEKKLDPRNFIDTKFDFPPIRPENLTYYGPET